MCLGGECFARSVYTETPSTHRDTEYSPTQRTTSNKTPGYHVENRRLTTCGLLLNHISLGVINRDVAKGRHLILHLVPVAHDHDRRVISIEILCGYSLNIRRRQRFNPGTEIFDETLRQIISVNSVNSPRQSGLAGQLN